MPGNQERFQQAMNQGHSAAWDQMWEKAASYYRHALEEIPDQPQALTNLGLALFEMQEYEQASLVYQRAARCSPDDPLPVEKVAQSYERLGKLVQASQASLFAAELYLKRRDVNKAIESWQQVIRLTPESLQAHTRLALVYERLGEKEKAVEEYMAAASLHQSAGDMERAIRFVNQALKIEPESKQALEGLALLKDFKPLPKPTRPRGGTAPLRMAQVRQLEAANDENSKERGMDPVAQARQRALTILAGMLFDGLDDVEEMIERPDLQSMVAGSSGGTSRPGGGAAPTGPVTHPLSKDTQGQARKSAVNRNADRTRIMLHISQVVDLQTSGDNAAATHELERALEAGLDHPAAFYDLGFLYVQTGRRESALRQLQRALVHPDFALAARLLLGELLSQGGRLKDATIEYLEALKLADSLVVPAEQADDLRQLYEPLIEAARQAKDTEIDVNLCENVKGMVMRPDWREQLSRARLQMPYQDGEGPLIPIGEMLTEARSSHVVASITTIHDLAAMGKLRSAMEEAFLALSHSPTYLPLHTYIGDLMVKQGQFDLAAPKFMTVARTYVTRGEPHRAIDLYRKIKHFAPLDLNARNMLIGQLLARHQVEEALQEYLELAEVYYNLANMDMVRKTYTEALRLAQNSNVDRSWRVQILQRIADIDLQSLDWRQAVRIYEQVRTLQPEDEVTRSRIIELNFRLGQETLALAELDNYLAYLSSRGQREKSLRFVENLVKESPEHILVRRRLADLYRSAGRTSDAIEQLTQVGDALLDSGDQRGAMQAYEAVLSFDPPNKEIYQQQLLQLKKSLYV